MPILFQIYMCGSGLEIRIRVHKAPENGSNTDPDPQHWVEVSLSTLRFYVMHTDPACPRNFFYVYIILFILYRRSLGRSR